MSSDSMGQSLQLGEALPTEEIETAMADLQWALKEDEVSEKHYHVRTAMQRLQVLLEKAER